MDRKGHWEKIYSTRSHREVSWYAEHVTDSLGLFRIASVPKDAPVIDVGGGASTLVDDLLAEGYADLTVLDISGAALGIARDRLGTKASAVHWIEADVLACGFGGRRFAAWHDRAVFHFLTEAADRDRYREQVLGHVAPGGCVLISVFAEDGPEKCSGVSIKRHGEDELFDYFGAGFEKLHAARSVHRTPAGAEQRFLLAALRRKA